MLAVILVVFLLVTVFVITFVLVNNFHLFAPVVVVVAVFVALDIVLVAVLNPS